MLKATESVDGQMRATLRVEYRIGLNELAAGCELAVQEQEGNGRVTRSDVIAALRDHIKIHGADFMEDFQFEGGPVADYLEYAADLFPEFLPKEEMNDA